MTRLETNATEINVNINFSIANWCSFCWNISPVRYVPEIDMMLKLKMKVYLCSHNL